MRDGAGFLRRHLGGAVELRSVAVALAKQVVLVLGREVTAKAE